MSAKKQTKESFIRRAMQVQEIYLEHTNKGVSNRYIYRKYIYPVYYISERTFYRYLARNAKKEIRELENQKT